MRTEAERILGGRIVRADRVYGGYAPSATFRLRLADRRRAFLKSTYPLPPGTGVRWGVPEEIRVYRILGARIRPWAPLFHGAFDRAGWQGLVLEDVGPADVPPWTIALLERAARDYAAFHAANPAGSVPRAISRSAWHVLVDRWPRADLDRTARLAGRRAAEAREWLDVAYPVLRDSAARLPAARGHRALLHLDTRSDNIRVRHGLRLFDWNFACVGPRELDVAAFAQAIAAEDGPAPDRFVQAYRRRLALDSGLLGSSASAIAGLFAQRAPEPPIEGLPRLRSFQRRQLKACLAWAARLLELPEPRWLRAVAD